MPSTVALSARGLSSSLSRDVKALAVILREEFDTPFRFYDSATGDRVVVHEQDEHGPSSTPEERALAVELAEEDHPKVVLLPDRSYLLGFPLDGIGRSRLVAVGIVKRLGQDNGGDGSGAVSARQLDSIGSRPPARGRRDA